VEFHQIKSFYTSSETNFSVARQFTEQEKNFGIYLSDKGLISRINIKVKNLNRKTTNNPNNKGSKKIGQFSEKGMKMANKCMKKSVSLVIKEM
jgi:hypothetical protein